jgi:hypothetical protein
MKGVNLISENYQYTLQHKFQNEIKRNKKIIINQPRLLQEVEE